MRKSSLIALAASSMIAAAEIQGRSNQTTRVDRINGVRSATVQGQKKTNKTANKLNVFFGYRSERKGKGEKKRSASLRRQKGWV